MDVLAASGRRCTLVDRGDMLSRHLTGAAARSAGPFQQDLACYV